MGLKSVVSPEGSGEQFDVHVVNRDTESVGSINDGTFPPHALGGYAEANPATASSNVVAGVVGMVTHTGADGSGNQHNLGVIGITNNRGTLGSDLVTNGVFAADTDWTKGTGWTISGGVASASAGSGSNLTQSVGALVASNLYRLIYTITRSAGTITPSVGGAAGVTRNASGTYTEWILCGGTTDLIFTKDASFAGSVDNVVLQRACHVVASYAVEGRTEHEMNYTGVAAGFIAAAQTVTEGASGMILVYADYLSESFNDHAHMYLSFSFLGNDVNKPMRNKGAIEGFKTSIVVETGNFTLSHDTHGGRTVVTTAANPQITAPNTLPLGFCVDIITQGGAADIIGTATLQHRLSHNSTAGANSVVGVKCRSNSGGSAAILTLFGDTAA